MHVCHARLLHVHVRSAHVQPPDNPCLALFLVLPATVLTITGSLVLVHHFGPHRYAHQLQCSDQILARRVVLRQLLEKGSHSIFDGRIGQVFLSLSLLGCLVVRRVQGGRVEAQVVECAVEQVRMGVDELLLPLLTLPDRTLHVRGGDTAAALQVH